MLFASWRNRHEFFIKKIQLYWSSCTALYLFFTFDLPFNVSSRHHERKPCGVLLEVGLLLSPLVNLSSCWSQWQGWLQIWYTGWERDYGSVPSAGRQKIQAVQDFLDIRKRFHEICKDLTVVLHVSCGLNSLQHFKLWVASKCCFHSNVVLQRCMRSNVI